MSYLNLAPRMSPAPRPIAIVVQDADDDQLPKEIWPKKIVLSLSSLQISCCFIAVICLVIKTDTSDTFSDFKFVPLGLVVKV